MLEASEQLEHLKLAAQVAGLEVPRFILPEDHDIVVNRMRFHYLDWGTKGRHPILFLHGGGLNAHTWDLVCLMLRDRYHCIALDQRGHGDSEWEPTADYRFDAQVADLEGFIEKLKLHRPLLVGHSMGGFAAMGYSIRHAATMAGVVLGGIAAQIHTKGSLKIRNFITQDRELDSVEEFVERALKFNPMRNRQLLRRSLLHNLRPLPHGKWTWKHDPKRMPKNFESERDERKTMIMDNASAIVCPTLVMRGARSDVLTDDNAREFAASVPKGRWLRVENAGHTIQGDNPRALLDALEPFLREIGI